jgi:hypothetical protein
MQYTLAMNGFCEDEPADWPTLCIIYQELKENELSLAQEDKPK